MVYNMDWLLQGSPSQGGTYHHFPNDMLVFFFVDFFPVEKLRGFFFPTEKLGGSSPKNWGGSERSTLEKITQVAEIRKKQIEVQKYTLYMYIQRLHVCTTKYT